MSISVAPAVSLRQRSIARAALPTQRALVCRASDSKLPAALQGLRVSDDGQHLIDEKTGKALNEFGATRFDVAVRAMRGEFDPPDYVENTERSSGLLLDSLTRWPAVYDFQLVIKTGSSSAQSPQELLEQYRLVIAEACASEIAAESCTVKERIAGKYVSLTIPVLVRAAQVIDIVMEALAGDPRVVMKY